VLLIVGVGDEVGLGVAGDDVAVEDGVTLGVGVLVKVAVAL
jgi:hypothetical protein